MNEKQEIDFKKLVSYSTDMVQVVDPSGIILYANLSWQTKLGYSAEEVIGVSIYHFITPEERQKYISIREEVIEKRLSNVFFETSLLTRNGSEVSVEGYISCECGDGVTYTHGILRDVSTRKLQQKKSDDMHAMISDRERQLNQLIHHAPDAIIVIDDESRIVLWNPKSEMIFGWSAEEVNGRLLGETIIPEQYRKMHYAGMRRYLSTGEEHVLNKTIEVTALRKGGTEFHIALTISKTISKGVNHFIAFIRDTSEQKKLEEDLKLQRQKLENRNEELAYYASMTTHDLKEPIRKILTFSDLLTQPTASLAKFTPEQIISRIQYEAKRMTILVDAVAVLSSVGVSKEEPGPVDINGVIARVLEGFDRTIKEKSATVVIQELPVVMVNRAHLNQLFHNLVSNSLKYSNPKFSPVIEISMKESNNNFIMISFSDNGLGFDNRYAQKVLEPFQRLHGKEFQGTGIGLAICKKIVEAYGGVIQVESEKEKGTIVTFTLPV